MADGSEQQEARSLRARASFGGLELEPLAPVLQLVQDLDLLVRRAEAEGKVPGDGEKIHIVLKGPPGTGKTTCAKRLAIALHELGLLPTPKIKAVTPSDLNGPYVGGGHLHTLDALRNAKGGVLFIDDAHTMKSNSATRPRWNHEIVDALVESFGDAEFSGDNRVVVIFAGYEQEVDQLFAEASPGFLRRFGARQITLPEWTGEQAAAFVASLLDAARVQMTDDARAALLPGLRRVKEQGLWASARELHRICHDIRRAQEGRSLRAAPDTAAASVACELSDVEAVFENVVRERAEMSHMRATPMPSVFQQPPPEP